MYRILREQETANFVKVGNCCDVITCHKRYYSTSVSIRYPLYFAKNIKLNNNQQLIECLLRLGDERNDWQANVPVQSIVDPKLSLVYFKQSQQYEDSPQNKEIYKTWGSDEFQRLNSEAQTCIAPERYKYHWKTTEFVVGKMFESVSINGQIPGVNINAYPEVNAFMERIFHVMLPAFNKIGKPL